MDQYTKLLLHCDGADGSQTFIDSATGKAVTAVGTAQVDTAQSKFGGASALFDGTGDYLTVPADVDWNFDGDFTIDFWMRNNAANNSLLIKSIINGDWNSTTTNDWALVLGGDDKLSFYVKDVGTAGASGTALVDGNWYHVAVVRSGTTITLYRNGVADGGTLSTSATLGNTGILVIGSTETNLTAVNFDGWLDEIRISKGIARWTANFTPPTKAYSAGGGGLGFGNPMIF